MSTVFPVRFGWYQVFSFLQRVPKITTAGRAIAGPFTTVLLMLAALLYILRHVRAHYVDSVVFKS